MTDLTDVLLGALVLIGSQLLIKLATQRIEGAPGRAQRAVQSDVELYNALPQDLKDGPEGEALRNRLTERLAQLTAQPVGEDEQPHAEQDELSTVEISFPLSVIIGGIVGVLAALISRDGELGLAVGTITGYVIFVVIVGRALWLLIKGRFRGR